MRGWMGRQWQRDTHTAQQSRKDINLFYIQQTLENMQGTVLGRHQEEKKSINTSPKWEKPLVNKNQK